MPIILTSQQIENYVSILFVHNTWPTYINDSQALSVADLNQLDANSLHNFLYEFARRATTSSRDVFYNIKTFKTLMLNMSDAQLDALLRVSHTTLDVGVPSYVSKSGGLLIWLAEITSSFSDTRIFTRILNLNYSLSELGKRSFSLSATSLNQIIPTAQLQTLNVDQLVQYLKPWLGSINLAANASTKAARMVFLKTLAWDNLTFFQRADLLRYYQSPSLSISFMDQLRSVMTGGAALVNINPLDQIIGLDVVSLNNAKPADRYVWLEKLVNDVFYSSLGVEYVRRLSQDSLRILYTAMTKRATDASVFGALREQFFSTDIAINLFGIQTVLTFTKADGSLLFSENVLTNNPSTSTSGGRIGSWSDVRSYRVSEINRLSLQAWNVIFKKITNPWGFGIDSLGTLQLTQVGGVYKLQIGNQALTISLGVMQKLFYGDTQVLSSFSQIIPYLSGDYLANLRSSGLDNLTADVLRQLSWRAVPALIGKPNFNASEILALLGPKPALSGDVPSNIGALWSDCLSSAVARVAEWTVDKLIQIPVDKLDLGVCGNFFNAMNITTVNSLFAQSSSLVGNPWGRIFAQANAISVSGVSLNQAGNGAVKAGAVIGFNIKLSQDITSISGTGMTLNLSNGRVAQYSSYAGDTITFTYTVAPGDDVADLFVSKLNLNNVRVNNRLMPGLSSSLLNPAGLLVVDTTAPNKPVVEMVNDLWINANEKQNGAGVRVRLNNTNAVAGDSISLSIKQSVASLPAYLSYTLTAADIANGFAVINILSSLLGISDSSLILSATITDVAGNTSLKSDDITVTIDSIAPRVTITSNNSVLRMGSTALITFSLSEASSNFSLNNVSVVGGSLGTLMGSGTSYTAIFTPTANITGTVQIGIGTPFTDLAGNTNSATVPLVMMVDSIAPTVSITSNNSSLKIGSTAIITFSLSEVSNNFISSTINVVGGSLGSLVGTGLSYTAVFTPFANSVVAGQISLGSSFTDIAGNSNTPPLALSLMVDTVVPTVRIDTNKTSLSLNDMAILTFSLSEVSTNFAAEDISVVGGVLSGFTGSGMSYTAIFVGNAESTQSATVSIKAGSFSDAVGNVVSLNTNSTKVMAVNTLMPITIGLASFSADSGISQTDLITNVSNQTISGTLSRALLVGEVVQVSVDNGNSWNNAAVTGTTYSFNTVISSSNNLKVRVKNAFGVQKGLITQAYVYDVTTPEKGIFSIVGDGNVWMSAQEKQDIVTPKFKLRFAKSKVSVGDKLIVKVINPATGNFVLWESDAFTSTHVNQGFKQIYPSAADWNNPTIAGEGVRIFRGYVRDLAGNESPISDEVSMLVTNDFSSLTSVQLNGLSSQLIASLPMGLLDAIASKANIMSGLSVDFLNKLAAESISVTFLMGLPRGVFSESPGLNEAFMQNIADMLVNNTDVQILNSSQIQVLSVNNLSILINRLLSLVASGQAISMPLWFVNGLRSDQVASLSETALTQFIRVEDVGNLSGEVIKGLAKKSFSTTPISFNLSDEQIGALTPNQIGQYFSNDNVVRSGVNIIIPVEMLMKLNQTQIAALPVDIFSSHFSVQQSTQLTQRFWSAVTPLQIGNLGIEAVNKLGINIASGINVMSLNADQIKALKGDDDATKASQLKSFFQAFYTVDPGNGSHVGVSTTIAYWLLNGLSKIQIRQLPQEVIEYCMPDLMSSELTNINLLKIIGERSYAANVLLLPVSRFQGLLNNQLAAFLLPWVSFAQANETNIPFFITRYFSASQIANIATLYPELLLKHVNISTLTAVQLNGLPVNLVEYLTLEWVSQINLEEVGNLSALFLNSVSDGTFMFLHHDFISRINRDVLLTLSAEKIRIMSLQFVHSDTPVFTALEMQQFDEAQLLAVFAGSVICEDDEERFANLTSIIGGLSAEKVRNVPWYLLQGTIRSASELERLKGSHVDFDKVINDYADQYLSAKNTNENSWLVGEQTRADNVNLMDNAIQQIKIALFNADHDALKLLSAATINKLALLSYSPEQGIDALDWDSVISSPVYPIKKSVKNLLFSAFNILTKDKIEGLSEQIIAAFGHYLKSLKNAALVKVGLNDQIQKLSNTQLDNLLNQWASSNVSQFFLEKLSIEQIKNLSEARLVKIINLDDIKNQSNHFLRGLGERAKLLGVTILNQAQMNTLGSRQLREFLSAWQTDGVYTLPLNIAGLLSAAQNNELLNKALKVIGNNAGELEIEIDLGSGAIEIGDKIQLWVDGKLWQVFDAKVNSFAQLSIDLSQVKEMLGKNISVRVLDKIGNLIATSLPLSFNLNAVQNVSASWLNSLADKNLVGNLSHVFLESLSTEVLNDYLGINAEFVNQISDFGSLSSDFLNRLPAHILSEIAVSKINLLSTEKINQLNFMWSTLFPQIESGYARFDYVDENAIEIALHLDQAVYLSDGKAVLQLELSNGAIAHYISGNGTSVLVFKYIFSGGDNISDFENNFSISRIDMQGSYVQNARGIKASLGAQCSRLYIDYDGTGLTQEMSDRSYAGISALIIGGNTDGINNTERTNGISVTLDLTGTTAKLGDKVELLLNGESFSSRIIKELTQSDISAGNVLFTIASNVNLKGQGHKVISAQITRAYQTIALGGNAEMFIDTLRPSIIQASSNISGVLTDASKEIIYTLNLNDSISNLTISDFNISQGTIQSVTGSGRTWEVRVRAASNTVGEIQLSLLENRVQDLVGNYNNAYVFPAQAINTIVPETAIQTPTPRNLGGDGADLSDFHFAALLGWMLTHGSTMFNPELPGFDLDNILNPVAEAPEVETVYRFNLGTLTWVMRTDVNGRTRFAAEGPCPLGEPVPVALDWERNTLTLEDGRILNLGATVRNIYRVYGEGDSYANFSNHHEEEVVIARTIDVFNFNVGDSVWEARVLENGEVALTRTSLGTAPGSDLMIREIDFERGRIIFSDGSSDNLIEARYHWRRAEVDTEIERGTTPLTPGDRVQAGVYRFMVGGDTPSGDGMPAIPGSVWELEVNALGEQILTQRVAGLDFGMVPVRVNVRTGEVIFSNADAINISDARLHWQNLNRVTSTNVIQAGNYQFSIGTTIWHVTVNSAGVSELNLLNEGEDFGVTPTSVDAATGRIYFADGSFATVNDRYMRFSRSSLSSLAVLSQGRYRLGQQILKLDRYGRGLFSITGELRANETPVEVNAETGVITYLDGHTANIYGSGWVHESDLTPSKSTVPAGEYQFTVDGNVWQAKVSSNGKVELSLLEGGNDEGRDVERMDLDGRIIFKDESSESIWASSVNWRLSTGTQGVLGKEEEDWTSAVEIGGVGSATNNLYTQVYMLKKGRDEGDDGGQPPKKVRINLKEKWDAFNSKPFSLAETLRFLGDLMQIDSRNPEFQQSFEYMFLTLKVVTTNHDKVDMTHLDVFHPYIDYLISKIGVYEKDIVKFIRELHSSLLKEYLIRFSAKCRQVKNEAYLTKIFFVIAQSKLTNFLAIVSFEFVKSLFIEGELTQAYIDSAMTEEFYGIRRLALVIKCFDFQEIILFNWKSVLSLDSKSIDFFLNYSNFPVGAMGAKIINIMTEQDYTKFPFSVIPKEKLIGIVPYLNLKYFFAMNQDSVNKFFEISDFVKSLRNYIYKIKDDDDGLIENIIIKLTKEQLVTFFRVDFRFDEDASIFFHNFIKTFCFIPEEYYRDIISLIPADRISSLRGDFFENTTDTNVFTDEQIRNFSDDQIIIIIQNRCEKLVGKLNLLVNGKLVKIVIELSDAGFSEVLDWYMENFGQDIRFDLQQTKELKMEIFNYSRNCQEHINDAFRDIDEEAIKDFFHDERTNTNGFEYLDQANTHKLSQAIINLWGEDSDLGDNIMDILRNAAHIVSSFSQEQIAHLGIDVLNRFAFMLEKSTLHGHFEEGIPLPTVGTVNQYEASLLNLIPITRLHGSDGHFNPDVIAVINSLGADKKILLNRDVYSFLAGITGDDIRGLSAEAIDSLDLAFLNRLSRQGVNLSTLFENNADLIHFITAMNKVVLVEYLKTNEEFRARIQPLMTVELWDSFGPKFFSQMITADLSRSTDPTLFYMDFLPELNDDFLTEIPSIINRYIVMDHFTGDMAIFARRILEKMSDTQLNKLIHPKYSRFNLFVYLNVDPARIIHPKLDYFRLHSIDASTLSQMMPALITKYFDKFIVEINGEDINFNDLDVLIPYLSDENIKRINSPILVKRMLKLERNNFREEYFLRKINIDVFYSLTDSFYGSLHTSILEMIVARLIDEVIFSNDADKKTKFSSGVYQNMGGENVAIDIAFFDSALGHLLDQFRTPLKPSFIIPNIVNQLMALLPITISSTAPFVERVKEWDHHAWSKKSGYGEINLLAALRKIVPLLDISLSEDATLPMQITKLGFNAAWAAGYRGQGINIAVIDSGIDVDNRDLMDHVDEAVSRRISSDGEIRDDFAATDRNSGHGTAVASMIVGYSRVINVGRQNVKLAGAAPNSTLVISNRGITDLRLILISTVNANVDIINISLQVRGAIILDQIQRAAEKGEIIVLSAGNDGLLSSNLTYNYWNVVFAGGSYLELANSMHPESATSGLIQSNFVLAPYDHLGLAKMGGGAKIWCGTSLSAPLVSSALAIILSAIDQQYSAEKIREDGSMYYDDDPTASSKTRISRVDRAKLAISTLVNTANSFVPYETAASEGTGASAGGGAGAPAGGGAGGGGAGGAGGAAGGGAGGSGAASGRSLAEESASFDALTNAMSGFGSDFSAGDTQQLPLAAQNSLLQPPIVMPAV
jgi:hypothetical protein